MANSRISSTSRLCYRYRNFFIATLVILFIQVLIGYNTGIKTDLFTRKKKPRSSLPYRQGKDIDDGKDPPPEPTDGYDYTTPYVKPVNLSIDGKPLRYHPKCHLTSEDTLSAISRARTALCKQEIADAACLAAEGKLFPKKLPSYCPLRGNHTKGHYYGCFKEKSQYVRDFSRQSSFENNMPSVCINYCLQTGYRYAGLQYGKECWCGQQFGKYGKVADEECAYLCPGDKEQKCGGALRNSVYSTGVIGPHRNKYDFVHSSNKTNEGEVRIVFVLTINGRSVRQVRRLLKAIYHSRHYYFIHVDMRQEYLYRELLPLESLLPNVVLAHRRFATIWGGASLLQAHLEFMKEVLHKGWKWDYYINLSESDYPIKKLDMLELFLKEYKGHIFLKSHGHDTARFIKKQGIDKMFYECDTHLWRLGPRQLPTNIVFDGGSDWVCLYRDFCEYVVNSEDELITGLKTFFTYTLLPAESFFHTVVHNSEFCDRWMDNNLHLTNWKRAKGCKCQYKHVVDWCGCSPNVLLTGDLDRLLKYENKAIFFARKFEPIVDLDIINSLDVYMFGNNMRDLRALTEYWQNEYHHLDSKEHASDAYLSFYNSFARRATLDLVPLTTGQCLVTPTQVKEAHVLYQSDRFHGLLVKYEGEVKGGGSVTLETHVLAMRDYKVLDPTGPMGRLISIEVGSNFDVKESIFRNYAQLLGPNSDITVKHMWGPGPEFTVSIAFVDPADIVAVSHDVVIRKTGHIGSHKPELKTPLRPGVWCCKLMLDYKVVAEVRFLVVPLTLHRTLPMTLEQIKSLHNGPAGGLYGSRNFSDFKDILHLKRDSDAQMVADLNGQKEGKVLEQWVDMLTKEFWEVHKTCLVGGGAGYCDMLEMCRKTSWSSLAPDPKSEIHGVNQTSGFML